MTRLMPSAVGASELVARPIVRRRSHGLSWLTAPTHGARFWLALWLAAAAAGFVAMIPVIFHRGPPVPGWDVMHDLSGVSFAACGLIAWRRRPDSAVGRLLTLAGFGILVPPIMAQIDSPSIITLATLFGELWVAAFVTLILSFVSGGRLQSTVDVAIVGVYLFSLFFLQFALMLFLDQPDNLLLVTPDAGVVSALTKLQLSVLAVASLAVVVVIGGAGGPPRGLAGARCCPAWAA